MADDHISAAELFENARLNTALSTDAQSHLASCEACHKELSWMQVAADMDIVEPPQSVMDKVLDAGRNTSRLKQLRNAITALLTFDSFSLAPVGVRSESASRQMTFEADGVEVGL